MRNLAPLAALLVLALPASAGTQGATAFDFLSTDVAPRPAAMGGAYTAVSDDADGMLYNPAGLAFMSSNQASFAHGELYQGITQDYLALAAHGDGDQRLGRHGLLGEGQGAGLYLDTFDFGSIQRTTLANQSGAGLDSFGIRDWAIGAGYAIRPIDWLGVGAAVKYLRESIDNTLAQTGAVDLGARADLEKTIGQPITLGAAIQNVGPDPRYRTQSSPMPETLRMGLAWQPRDAYTVAVDLVDVRDGSVSTRIGGEWRPTKYAALRLGWNGQNDAGPGVTVGASLTWKKLRFDYAFIPYGDMGDAQRIGVSYSW
ncbi:MAG TPA: PorV/PorQ family protein [Elusimicrobiota bacterium]|nr:PorV/PorQ family protein [Elusimicrobiota bacterium]